MQKSTCLKLQFASYSLEIHHVTILPCICTLHRLNKRAICPRLQGEKSGESITMSIQILKKDINISKKKKKDAIFSQNFFKLQESTSFNFRKLQETIWFGQYFFKVKNDHTQARNEQVSQCKSKFSNKSFTSTHNFYPAMRCHLPFNFICNINFLLPYSTTFHQKYTCTHFLKFDCECDINNFYPTMIVSSPLQFHHLQHQFSAPHNSTTSRQKYMWYKICYIILTMPIMNTVLIIQSRLQIQTS